LWGNVPQTLRHSLHQHPLFSRDALGELIERMPRERYSLIQMGEQGARKLWREGDIAGLSGAQVIDWIERGRLWINMREVNKVDPRYAEVLERVYAEIAAKTGQPSLYNLHMGILISSPRAQVYYHCDMLGQALWQILGRKRLIVFPNHPPFLTQRQLEDIAVMGVEVDLDYSPWFEDYARIVELEPGQMAHWPLNGPHRVENLDMLNVSVTTEHLTPAIERRYRVVMANGLARHRLGFAWDGMSLSGPSYWMKAAFQSVLRRSRWLERVRAAKRPIAFRLDPSRPGGVVETVEPAGDAAQRAA
jgi:hypothetical protein